MWWAPSSLGFYYARAAVCPCPFWRPPPSPRPQLQKHLRRFPSVSISSYAVSHSKKCIGLGSYTDLHDIRPESSCCASGCPPYQDCSFSADPKPSLIYQPDIREELDAVVKGCLKESHQYWRVRGGLSPLSDSA